MPRKNDDASHQDDLGGAQSPIPGDHPQTRREQAAREPLLRLGGEDLPAPPWRPDRATASAVDLAHLALWRSQEAGPEDLLSALALMPSARAEVDGLESGLLFTARAAGLTWAQIAVAMGFNSPQACQQHFTRLAARRETER